MADQRYKKQNILPAVSDDLMERIKALQDLYKVGDKPATIEFILDRALTALVQQGEEKQDG